MQFRKFSSILLMAFILFLSQSAFAADAIRPPNGLKLKIADSHDGFSLQWEPSQDDPARVAYYEIARASLAGGPFETVGKVKKGQNTFHDRSIKPEIIYFYKVRAIGGQTASDYSNVAAGELPQTIVR